MLLLDNVSTASFDLLLKVRTLSEAILFLFYFNAEFHSWIDDLVGPHLDHI